MKTTILIFSVFSGLCVRDQEKRSATGRSSGKRGRMNPVDIRIIVATHKKYRMPDDPMYLPVQAGAFGKESIGYQQDDEGENISEKNAHFCELTALYWAWKNLDAEAIGLVHYRRYFAKRHFSKQIARETDIQKALEKAPVILPGKRHYWIETNYSHYVHAHHEQDLTITREVLAERCPDYLPAYAREMAKRSGHRFNMLVMRWDFFNAWCGWLFPILFEIEKRLDISAYDEYNSRVFGFLAERLLDVWMETNHVPYTELPVKNTESQHWLRKGTTFVMRKFGRQIR